MCITSPPSRYSKAVLQPDEIAATVLFLASDASNYMPGSEVVVDVGFAKL
jgi:NAD(P)-dependent dehydrogenase (short-subunit alcohol dehydrogenase family)